MTLSNGRGGFTDDGRTYAIALDGAEETPMPWANVIANPQFGTIVTASGSAHTWSGNSRENRLTPFANDPISDPTARGDPRSRRRHRASRGRRRRDRLPAIRLTGRCIVRHTAGLTQFSSVAHGIGHELDVFVDADRSREILAAHAGRTTGLRRGR